MKFLSYISIVFFLASGIFSCNKVEKAYQPNITDLDSTLYPGDWNSFTVPDFSENMNTERNVLIEDFTGHKCTYCPWAADNAHQIKLDNPGRVYIASIHGSPNGISGFQTVDANYPHDFTNEDGLEISIYFGTNDGGFPGNPRGPVSRITYGGNIFQHPQEWNDMTNSAIAQNNLKVNLQAQSEYYPETRGYFLFTEIDILATELDPNNLAQVVYLMEDSLVGDQKMEDNSHNTTYIHRDIMRGCIDGRAFGRTLSPANVNLGTLKHELYYTYKVPDNYTDLSNLHVLIYVYDKTTFEIYQVIKEKIQ